MKTIITDPNTIRKYCPDILRWQPSTWEQFLGNKRIIKHFRQLVRKLRRVVDDGAPADLTRLSFLLYGLSRSGKTALVKFLVRCLTCKEFDTATLNPCDKTCPSCNQCPENYGLVGIYSYMLASGHQVPVHFSVVDCTMIETPAQLRDKLLGITSFAGLHIYYFDEVHRLVSRGMDEMLLKKVEDTNALWFFSTAKPGGLEDMFQNRLLKLKTELPTVEELEDWLVERCEAWGLNWEPEAIARIADKSNQVVGTALHALAIASLNPEEGVTLDLVENDWLVKTDE